MTLQQPACKSVVLKLDRWATFLVSLPIVRWAFFIFSFWKIGGTTMTKQLNWIEFFSDKELWFKWFVRTDLPEDTKKQCQDLMDLDLFDLNWRVSLGVTVKWDYVKDHLPESAAFEHLGEYKTVFLNLHQSFLEEGKADIPGNDWIWVYHAKRTSNLRFHNKRWVVTTGRDGLEMVGIHGATSSSRGNTFVQLENTWME
jgi:hypothetical protein